MIWLVFFAELELLAIVGLLVAIQFLREHNRNKKIVLDRYIKEGADRLRREAELLPALRWAAAPESPADIQNFLFCSTTRESFNDALSSIKNRYNAHIARAAEQKILDEIERELNARKRLVPLKRTRKGGGR